MTKKACLCIGDTKSLTIPTHNSQRRHTGTRVCHFLFDHIEPHVSINKTTMSLWSSQSPDKQRIQIGNMPDILSVIADPLVIKPDPDLQNRSANLPANHNPERSLTKEYESYSDEDSTTSHSDTSEGDDEYSGELLESRLPTLQQSPSTTQVSLSSSFYVPARSRDVTSPIPVTSQTAVTSSWPLTSFNHCRTSSEDSTGHAAGSGSPDVDDPDYLSDHEVGAQSVFGQSSKQRRKASKPTKSARPEDPKFKGVTVQFRTRVHQQKIQFLVTAYFNCRKLTRRRWRHGFMLSTSSPIFQEPRDPLLCARIKQRASVRRDVLQTAKEYPSAGVWYSSGKQCASCDTRKTPLWRDAEDGTPLCNACGIRYKKYRVRCGHCWFVPKKDAKMKPMCSNCGEVLRYSFFRLRPAII